MSAQRDEAVRAMIEFSSPVIETSDLVSISIEGASSSKQYQLEIDISSVEFVNHPLFTEEHELAGKMTRLFEQVKVYETALALTNIISVYEPAKATDGRSPHGEAQGSKGSRVEIAEVP